MAFSTSLGDPFKHLPRIGTSTLETICSLGTIVEPWGDLSLYVRAATSHCLNGVHEPFWRNWPLSDPSVFLPPEILHHWHRFSWDHDAKWCIRAVGNLELDFRYSLLQPRTGHWYFKAGISQLKQVTGHDQREIQ